MKTQGPGGWAWGTPQTSAQGEMPGVQDPGLQVAPTPCNSNSMWKYPLVPVGLLLSGVGASPHEGGEAATTQQTGGDLRGRARRPRMVKGGGLSAGCRDRVHRALTYELTASALVSPLAANSIGHRYVRLNASCQDLWGRAGTPIGPVGNEELLPQCGTQGPTASCFIPIFPIPLLSAQTALGPPILTALQHASVFCPCYSLCLEHPSQHFCQAYSY